MAKKDENMTKRKLLSALFMLLITAIALTTASYSWFTANATVGLDGLDVTVSASNGIQLSTDAITWKARLTTTDLKGNAYIGHQNQIPTALVPVSSALGVSGGKLQLFTGEIFGTSTYYLKATQATEKTAAATAEAASTSGNFIAFDVFIQSSQAETIRLTPTASVVPTVGKADNGLQNSARVAFLLEGSTTVGDVSGAISKTGATEAKLWEPNSTRHTTAGIAAASSVYQVTATDGGSPLNYYGIRAAIAEDPTPANNIVLNSTNSTYFTQLVASARITDVASTPELFQIPAGISKVRVYAWIEGQDVDCENNASGTGITFNIELTKTAP